MLGGRICRWLLLFQEYDFEIIVKPGRLNAGPDHLSQIDSGEEPSNLDDNLLDAPLFSIQIADDYYADCYGEKFLWLGVPQQTVRLQKSIFPNMQ